MDLSKFVEETLVAIQVGVKDANIAIAKAEGTKIRENGEMQYNVSANRSGDKDGGVLFDVAVSVTSNKKTGGEGKISVVGISVGGLKNLVTTEQSVSRIKFKIDPWNSIF